MRYILTILAFTIMFSQFSWADTARVICGKDAAFAKLERDWKFNKKENSHCASAHCPYPDGSMIRQQCITRFEHHTHDNQIAITFRDSYQGHQVSGVKSRVAFELINKDDACFESCKPEQKGKKVIFGIDRKPCVECLKQKTAAEMIDTLNYPELEKPIVSGTKCYSLCSDKPGPFSAVRVLSPECTSCVKERFYFIVSKSGACMEVDSEKKMRMVNKNLCQAPNEIEFTEYRFKQSFWQSFTGDAGDCHEVDIATGGNIFSRPTQQEYCNDKAVNDTDRNIVDDKQKSSPSSKPKAQVREQ
ncbi:MAG: hypothetical protein ACLGG0_14970 [Bacteriovoracia bacterium]